VCLFPRFKQHTAHGQRRFGLAKPHFFPVIRGVHTRLDVEQLVDTENEWGPFGTHRNDEHTVTHKVLLPCGLMRATVRVTGPVLWTTGSRVDE
jgi:hypothetical protein